MKWFIYKKIYDTEINIELKDDEYIFLIEKRGFYGLINNNIKLTNNIKVLIIINKII